MKGFRNSRRRGFTLIEVMLVLTILVILASLAVMALGPIKRQANVKAAQAQVGLLKTAVDKFYLDMNYYPTDLRELLSAPNNNGKWAGPYLDNANLLDPWGNSYKIASPSTHTTGDFDVWSAGPDGSDNTGDDIGNWTSQ